MVFIPKGIAPGSSKNDATDTQNMDFNQPMILNQSQMGGPVTLDDLKGWGMNTVDAFNSAAGGAVRGAFLDPVYGASNLIGRGAQHFAPQSPLAATLANAKAPIAYGADPDSLFYKGGRLGGNIAGAAIPGTAALRGTEALGAGSRLALGAGVLTDAVTGAAMNPDNPKTGAILGGGARAAGMLAGKAATAFAESRPGEVAKRILMKAKTGAVEGLQKMRDLAKGALIPPDGSLIDTSPIEGNIADHTSQAFKTLTGGMPIAQAAANTDRNMSAIVKGTHDFNENNMAHKYQGLSQMTNALGGSDTLNPEEFAKIAPQLINAKGVPPGLKAKAMNLISSKKTIPAFPRPGDIAYKNASLTQDIPASNMDLAHTVQSQLGSYGSAAQGKMQDPIIRETGNLMMRARAALQQDMANHHQNLGLGKVARQLSDEFKNTVQPFRNSFADVIHEGETNPSDMGARFKNPNEEMANIVSQSHPDLVRNILLDRVKKSIGTLSGTNPEKLVSAVDSPSTFEGYEDYLQHPVGEEFIKHVGAVKRNLERLKEATAQNKDIQSGMEEIQAAHKNIDIMPASELIAKLPEDTKITPEMGRAVVAEHLEKAKGIDEIDPKKIVNKFSSLYGKGLDDYAEASGLKPEISGLKQKIGSRNLFGRLAGFGVGVLTGSTPLEIVGALVGHRLIPSIGVPKMGGAVPSILRGANSVSNQISGGQ